MCIKGQGGAACRRQEKNLGKVHIHVGIVVRLLCWMTIQILYRRVPGVVGQNIRHRRSMMFFGRTRFVGGERQEISTMS